MDKDVTEVIRREALYAAAISSLRLVLEENVALTKNLSSVQERCTALLMENRELKKKNRNLLEGRDE
jgi:hypothetical protein